MYLYTWHEAASEICIILCYVPILTNVAIKLMQISTRNIPTLLNPVSHTNNESEIITTLCVALLHERTTTIMHRITEGQHMYAHVIQRVKAIVFNVTGQFADKPTRSQSSRHWSTHEIRHW